jgi:hypothetical protein
MLETYIKNRGMTKTLIHSNNKNQINEIQWDADYDGNRANIDLDIENQGHHNKLHFTLDNNDLANILNVNSVNLPLHKRLKNDFQKNRKKPLIYQIEIEENSNPFIIPKKERYVESLQEEPISLNHLLKKTPFEEEPKSLEELYFPPKPYLSSPNPNEEYIIPVSIGDRSSKKYTYTPTRKHKKFKTHKSYKVYKKYKTTSNSKRKKNRYNSKSTRTYTI